MDIVNKILFIIFFLSSLNVFRHFYYVVQSWLTTDTNNTITYKITKIELFLLGLSIAYILSSIFTGITL